MCARACVCGCVCVTVGGGEWWARVRGLSCYNNPNRLTGKALTVEGAAACSLWKGRRDQSEGLVPEWGGGASSSCCSLTSGEGKSPAGKSVERQIGADRGGDAIGRSGRGRVDCSRNRTITTTTKKLWTMTRAQPHFFKRLAALHRVNTNHTICFKSCGKQDRIWCKRTQTWERLEYN